MDVLTELLVRGIRRQLRRLPLVGGIACLWFALHVELPLRQAAANALVEKVVKTMQSAVDASFEGATSGGQAARRAGTARRGGAVKRDGRHRKASR